MISKFLREQKRYTQRELVGIFECSEEKAVLIIRKLKEYGVLKAVKAVEVQRDMSDLDEKDIQIADVDVGANEYLYVITFVGIIVVAGRVLKCYPKYISKNDPKKELQQILKVLEKYNAKEQLIRIFNDTSEGSSFNLLAVLLFMIQDYYEYGVYSNPEDVIESNGSGEILWDKTINETFALISNNRPYYTNLQTKKRISNDFDYFKRLHECILTKASTELKEADLLDFFELTEIDLTDEELEEFGDKEYILYRIENELSVQYNTRKQMVLKTIYIYITHDSSLCDSGSFSLFGTNSFNLVWEGILADVMDNQLEKRLETLKMPIDLRSTYDKKEKLIDLIEKPLWSVTGKTANDTLIPDIITISGNRFVILDAKYYNVFLEPGNAPKGQPGIESITKQYIYQLAYKRFIEDHGFKKVINCFLMPTEQKIVEDKKTVRLEMMAALDLKDIEVRLLPADLVYNYYLSGKHMTVDELLV